MKVLSLFAGIGGFDLGLERAGMQTVAFCEINPFARRVLAQHWPEVPCHDDIRTLSADWLAENGLWPDVICGGFPCQDISLAGKGAGIRGERSGFWREYARLIGEIRPRYVIVENVAALLGRGLGDVLGDLAALGYDAEWHCIPASHVGAPHRRDRVWVVAYPAVMFGYGCEYNTGSRSEGPVSFPEFGNSGRHADVADANGVHGGSGWKGGPDPGCEGEYLTEQAFCHTYRPRLEIGEGQRSNARQEQPAAFGTNWWSAEPDVGRVAHGVPSRVDRLRSLGNAVVPQIPELIGLAILAEQQ